MLYFLKQMHNQDRDRLERGQVVFDLKAIHIVEAGVVSKAASQSVHSAPQQLIQSCNKADVPLYVVPLEAAFLPTEQAIPLDTATSCHCLPELQQDLRSLLQVQ